MTPPDPTALRSEELADQLGRLIDLYKHHFDLFLKGVAVYLAAVAVIAGYIQNSSTQTGAKITLSFLISLTSVFGIAGCVVSKRFVRQMQERLDNLTRSLSFDHIPLEGAMGIARMTIVVSVFVFLGGIAYGIYLARG